MSKRAPAGFGGGEVLRFRESFRGARRFLQRIAGGRRAWPAWWARRKRSWATVALYDMEVDFVGRNQSMCPERCGGIGRVLSTMIEHSSGSSLRSFEESHKVWRRWRERDMISD